MRFISSLVMSTFNLDSTNDALENRASRYVKRAISADKKGSVPVEFYVGSVNVRKNHWTCFKIDGASRTITYIDSYGKKPPKKMLRAMRAIERKTFGPPDAEAYHEPFTLKVVTVCAQEVSKNSNDFVMSSLHSRCLAPYYFVSSKHS